MKCEPARVERRRRRTGPRPPLDALTRTRQLAWGLFTSLLVLGLVEAGLRAARFRYDSIPRYMRFGYPRAKLLAEVFQPDPILFWRLIPGELYLPDRIAVNRRGYRGPEFETRKPAGAIRVLALGDSCTFLGHPAYPELLEAKLRAALPGKSVEVLNLAVPGYSSWQGRRQIETEGLRLQPDLVLVYFGWNDTWTFQGVPDKLQRPAGGSVAAIRGLLNHLRLYQFENWAVTKTRLALFASPGFSRASGSEVCRVSLADYRDNLRAMIQMVRSRGGEAVLITAPTGARTGPELAPYLVTEGMVSDPEWALARHSEYNEAAREVAAAEQAPLVDAAREFDRRRDPGLFWRDNIHLSDSGSALLADLILAPARERIAKSAGERQ